MKKLFLLLIRLYQHTLSLDHGPLKIFKPFGQCKFYPSCSEYCFQAIERSGIAKGVFLSLKRILRCNPWSKGGIDQI